MSERLGDGIIPMLSAYLDAMSREVAGHGGTIDKFIGDAVMAFWGAPAANPDHAVDACRAALACQQAIRAADWQDDGGRPLRVRIGINSGDMLVGNIGSDLRLNYTVIGDAGERRKPARGRQQGVWHRDHHRGGNPRGFCRRRDLGARARPADGLRPARRA